MHRLFVALRPPPSVRAGLIEVMTDIGGARWQDDDQLHLTLRFIGDVDRPQAEDIAVALAAIDHTAPTIAVAGVGTFARRDRPHTLWSGVTPHDQLASLHRNVDRALERAAIPPDQRAFHPHITLARMNMSVDRAALNRWLLDHRELTSDTFIATHIVLYESTLNPIRAQYDAVARWTLRPATAKV